MKINFHKKKQILKAFHNFSEENTLAENNIDVWKVRKWR